jgi:hypothetical protein
VPGVTLHDVAERSSADAGDAALEPAAFTSRREFLEALGRRRLLSGDTFNQLERQTGIPKSTLSDMLSRHRTPRREVVERVVRFYAANDTEAERWLRTWSQLSLQEVAPADPAVPATPPAEPAVDTTPTLDAPERRRIRRRWVVLGLVGVLAIISASVVVGIITGPAARRSPDPPAATSSATAGGSPAAPVPSPTGAPSVALRVYNVEADCRRLRTETCALRLSRDPRAVPSIANRAGEVWHDDVVRAVCAITDGRAVTDEKLNSSRVWYFVQVPATTDTGWLPGIRVRPAPKVPAC